MTPEELLEAIESDAEANQMAKVGDDSGCAARMAAILPKVRVSASAKDVMTIAARNGRWGAIALTCHKDDTDFTTRSVCKTFVDWVNSGSSIDIALGSVQQMIDVLLNASLITSSDISEIESLSWVPQVITANDVSAAMSPRRPGGRI